MYSVCLKSLFCCIPFYSAEVVQYLQSDLLPSIAQTETAINEAEAATSETGTSTLYSRHRIGLKYMYNVTY